MSQVVLLLLHHLDSRLLRMPAAPEVQDRLTCLSTGLPVDDCRSSLGRSESKYRRLGHELVLGSIEDSERGEVDLGSIEDLDRLLSTTALLLAIVPGLSDRLVGVLSAPGFEAAADEWVHVLDVQEDGDDCC